jgi:subtilisin family serine protease
MHRFTVLALVGMVLAALAAGTAAAGGPAGTSLLTPGVDYVDGQVLVGYAPGVSQFAQQLIEDNIQAEEVSTIGAGTRVLRVAKGQVIGKIAQLASSSGVRYAQPNYIHHADLIPNDASFAQLWGLRNTGQAVLGTTGTAGADIKATQAWDITTGSKTIVVGVVDTGVDYNHPDLAANIWSNPGVAGCAAGTHGYNAITKTCNPMDDHSHGTHVAGTIGGVGNNGVGVAGVNWNVSIMALKFLDASGSGSTADAITAIDFAVNAKIAGVNVRALNNSWGGGPFEQALLDAINRAGANDIMFLAAAGNSALNNDTNPHYPSSYNAANEIAVAATDQSDGLASFSNYGATSVHLGAPGTNIYSTVLAGAYDWFNGTSMATPHVAGAAALVLAKCNQTTATLKDILLKSVTPLSSLAGRTTTGGRLNVFAAINDPRCTTAPPPTPDYTLSATPASQSVVQ